MLPFRCYFLAAFCLFSGAAFSSETPPLLLDAEGRKLPVLRGGWNLWYPYQYLELKHAARVEATLDELTGIDIDITYAVARKAGFAVDFKYRPWQQHLLQLRSGEADIISGITRTTSQEDSFYFSVPYRNDTTVLYLRRGLSSSMSFQNVDAMLTHFRDHRLRLGVLDGVSYSNPALNTYAREGAASGRVVFAETDFENFRNLLSGAVDGILTDRLSGASAVWRGGWREEVEQHPLRIQGKVGFAFSKETVRPEVVAKFNQAIEELQREGTLHQIIASYQLPVLLGRILDSQWFFILDVIGTIAFALSGVLIAAKERYSILGALLLAALPAVGGGIIRDLIVGRETLAVLASPLYLGLIVGTVVTGYVVLRFSRWLEPLGSHPLVNGIAPPQNLLRTLYQLSDTVGLAAFTVTGVAVAISTKCEPLWVWGPILAAITAAGGGILRDLVRQSGKISSLHTEFYAEVPLIWGLFLTLLLIWAGPIMDPERFRGAVVLTLLGAFFTRIFIISRHLKSPAFR